MLIQNRYIIDDFIKEHPISRKALNGWEITVRQAVWAKPSAVKQTFAGEYEDTRYPIKSMTPVLKYQQMYFCQ